MCVFECYSVAILRCGAETGTLTRADSNRLMAAEVRFSTTAEGKFKSEKITGKKQSKELSYFR